jgi:hypothetical protein
MIPNPRFSPASRACLLKLHRLHSNSTVLRNFKASEGSRYDVIKLKIPLCPISRELSHFDCPLKNAFEAFTLLKKTHANQSRLGP